MNMRDDDIDRRITDALRAAAGQVGEDTLRPALAPNGDGMARRNHVRWTAPLLAAAAVAAVVVGTVAVASTGSSSAPRRIPVGSQLPDSPSGPVRSTNAMQTTAPATPPEVFPPQTSNSSPPAGASDCTFVDMCPAGSRIGAYLPIWPFASYQQARAWQVSTTKDALASRYGDALLTATAFVHYFLKFTDLEVVDASPDAAPLNDRKISVGFKTPSGGVQVAAVLHLVQYGSQVPLDAAPPWEVVGTVDDPSVLTITSPAYAGNATSPVTVSGRSTGVDENLNVTIHDVTGGALGSASVATGGNDTPWSVSVPYQVDPGARAVRVAAVFVGGALVQHSRFALQAFYG